MPHNFADLRGLGPEFFAREEALLAEHKRRVAGLGNIFQKLPWLTARSPLGGGCELDFLIMHSLMRPRGTPPSLLRRTDYAGAVGADAAQDRRAAALEAKRRLLLRQKRRQSSMMMRRAPSFQFSSGGFVVPSSARGSFASATAGRRRSSLGDAAIDDGGESQGDELSDQPAMPPSTPVAPDAVDVTTEEAAEADAAALARFREPCERWACDEESLLLNRLADLAARQGADGQPLPRREVLRRLADDFGQGAMQRLRGPILHTLRQMSAAASTSVPPSRTASLVGVAISSQPGPGGSGSANSSGGSDCGGGGGGGGAQQQEEGPGEGQVQLSPFVPAMGNALRSPTRRRRRSPFHERDVFVRHVLRAFVPARSSAPAVEMAAAAESLANPILRGHVGIASHPLLHEELCAVPALADATMEALERQQAMFLTYRNTVKHHRPRCLKDISQELDDEATMRRITQSVFSEAVTTAADRMAALSDLLANSPAPSASSSSSSSAPGSDQSYATSSATPSPERQHHHRRRHHHHNHQLSPSPRSGSGGGGGGGGAAAAAPSGGAGEFTGWAAAAAGGGAAGPQPSLSSAASSAVEELREAERRVRRVVAEWEQWLRKVAETQAAYNRLGRVYVPIVSPEEEALLVADEQRRQRGGGGPAAAAAAAGRGQPEGRGSSGSLAGVSGEGDGAHGDNADVSGGSGYDSTEAVMGDSDEAEDSFMLPSERTSTQRLLRRAALKRKDVLAFGKRHALDCVVAFDTPAIQADCRRAAKAGLDSFRRSAHLLLLVDRLWGAAEAIWNLAREARRAYKEDEASAFLEAVGRKAEDLRACMNGLVCDVVKQPSLAAVPVAVVAERLAAARAIGTELDEVLGAAHAATPSPLSPAAAAGSGLGGTGDRLGAGGAAGRPSGAQGGDGDSIRSLEAAEELLALAMPQMLLLQSKATEHFHALVASPTRRRNSSIAGGGGSAQSTPARALGAPEMAFTPAKNNVTASAARGSPSPPRGDGSGSGDGSGGGGGGGGGDAPESATLWQRARFAGVREAHGDFSWVSHRIVIGPLLLYRDDRGAVVDDARALVAACAAKNCTLGLVVSVCKDYVLSGESFDVVPVTRAQLQKMGVAHLQIRDASRNNLLKAFNRILNVIVSQQRAVVYIHGKTGNTKAWIPALCFLVAQMGMGVPMESAVEIMQVARPSIKFAKKYLRVVGQLRPALVDMFQQLS